MRFNVFFIVFLQISTFLIADTIDYGADIVNAMQERKDMEKGGRADYDYLALKNHKGPSGVPLGGIGTGCFDIAPNGSFTRIALNNTHEDGVLKDVKGSFFAFWNGESTRVLQLNETAGLKPVKEIVYTGLFPRVHCEYDCNVTLDAYSGLVPHDIKNSSLPVVWFEVNINNNKSNECDYSVAFSWEDIISRGILDFPDLDVFDKVGNNAWGLSDIRNKFPDKRLRTIDRVNTYVKPVDVGRFSGLLQYSEPIIPNKATYQNYVNNVAILAEKSKDVDISYLPSWDPDDDNKWNAYISSGKFEPSFEQQSLHIKQQVEENASVVSVKTRLKPGESKKIRFMLVWFYPEFKIDKKNADPRSYFGKADYGRYFHNYFYNINDLILYASRNRSYILNQTVQWQKPILESTMPDWLKFKLINSGYVIYTNCILNKSGDFTSMEGLMGGLAGTMDQRMSSHPFYQKFFTELDRSELELFGHTTGSEGQILHFDGHYYLGLSSRDDITPTPEGWMLDNTGSWLVQLAKQYQQTGDIEYIKQFRSQIKSSVAFLKNRMRGNIEIPIGYTTYDDFPHPEIYAYTATTYPVFLEAAIILARALDEDRLCQECIEQRQRSVDDAKRYVWNGKYFSYGCDVDGSNRRDDIMFSGQLAGPFLSRYCNWDDIFPLDMIKASLIAQFKTNIVNSIDYYAPKVWNIANNSAELWEHNGQVSDSTCWPFYLESYTAMAAIQNGYVEDGLNIMKHIQLVHLRNGWTWTQNLWRPGEATYMTAPVTWFITDVLAGAGVDVTNNKLFLAPVVGEGQSIVKLPLYYPKFWANVVVDVSKRKAYLEVTNKFGDDRIVIDKLVCRPVGISQSAIKQFKIKPFVISVGARLDLSSYFNALTRSECQKPILNSKYDISYLEYHDGKDVAYPHIKSADDIFVNSVEVSITCDKGDILYSLDGTDPYINGIEYEGPFKINNDTMIKAVAVYNGNCSPIQSKTINKSKLIKPDLSREVKLSFKLYEGVFQTLPEFDSISCVKRGYQDDLNLSDLGVNEYFAVIYDGSVTIPADGVYDFYLRSDDGSKLTIGDCILENDGIHDAEETKKMSLPLAKGIHSVKIEYFENTGGELLEIFWEGAAKGRTSLF